MKYHLISGACGFVGRNLVKRLLRDTEDGLLLIDDLSVGTSPASWLWADEYWPERKPVSVTQELEHWGEQGRVFLWKGDIRLFLQQWLNNPTWFEQTYDIPIHQFTDVFHFAAIVGGRAKIDGDPMMVALDLAIDAEFFYWAVRHQPKRILYPSSSAAYPIQLQAQTGHQALAENAIDFKGNLGKPDMTYGWSKLTGEYLARIAAEYYGLHVACVRPFSGYGEDQDLSYPIPAIARRAALREDPFEVWGTGKQGRDFVHIDDCVDAILFALDHIKDGSAMNIGSGHITSFLEIIELFTSFAQYKPDILPLLDKPVGVHARYADMEYVFHQLGWKPQLSLTEGMRRVYDEAVKRVQQEQEV